MAPLPARAALWWMDGSWWSARSQATREWTRDRLTRASRECNEGERLGRSGRGSCGMNWTLEWVRAQSMPQEPIVAECSGSAAPSFEAGNSPMSNALCSKGSRFLPAPKRTPNGTMSAATPGTFSSAAERRSLLTWRRSKRSGPLEPADGASHLSASPPPPLQTTRRRRVAHHRLIGHGLGPHPLAGPVQALSASRHKLADNLHVSIPLGPRGDRALHHRFSPEGPAAKVGLGPSEGPLEGASTPRPKENHDPGDRM